MEWNSILPEVRVGKKDRKSHGPRQAARQSHTRARHPPEGARRKPAPLAIVGHRSRFEAIRVTLGQRSGSGKTRRRSYAFESMPDPPPPVCAFGNVLRRPVARMETNVPVL